MLKNGEKCPDFDFTCWVFSFWVPTAYLRVWVGAGALDCATRGSKTAG